MSMQFINRDFAASRVSAIHSPVSARVRRTRLILVSVVALIWSTLLVSRIYQLQFSEGSRWREWAAKQHSSEIELAAERGSIVDREGRLLAVSVPAGSVYVRPKLIKDKELAATKIADVVKLPLREVRAALNEKKSFVWLQRQLPRAMAQQVADLNIDGLGYVLESRRYYPYKEAASTLIGKVGIDGHGLSGLEQQFEKTLAGPEQKVRVVRDALGKLIEASAEDPVQAELPKGKSLALTIDAGLQIIADEELQAGLKDANAKAALAALADAETGEILAFSQAPTANFNLENIKNRSDLTNRIVETVFEPGSIMKPLVVAAALDAGLVHTQDLVDCEKGRYSFGSHVIKDVHPSGVISVRDVVIRSSNIGMTKIGARMGANKLYAALRAFGFGELSGLGLPGESGGILRDVSSWAQVDVATHSFGQGIAVTPLQMLRAMSAIANGGTLPPLRVLAGETTGVSRRVLSAKTAAQVRELLYGVVEDQHGTGNKAAIEGVRVAGKTGTAQKANPQGRGYLPGAYVASFVGFVDGRSVGVNRSLSLIVVVDEPNTNTIYGGTLAAPVFKRIMQRSLHALGMQGTLADNSGDQIVAGQKNSNLLPVSFVQ